MDPKNPSENIPFDPVRTWKEWDSHQLVTLLAVQPQFADRFPPWDKLDGFDWLRGF